MSRSRRRTRSRTFTVLAVLGLVVVAALGQGTGAYTTGRIDRTSNVDVTADSTGVYGIDTAAAVHTNSTERLVTLTNRLGRDVSVTVSLRSGSTDAGDLVVDGENVGDEVTLSLTNGDSRRIDVRIPDNETLVGRTVGFDARATATGLHATAANRSVTIES